MTTPTVAELRRRAKRTELRTRIAQLARVYPDTHASLLGIIELEHPDELEGALGRLELMLRGALTAALKPRPANPVAEAVRQIQQRKQATMTTPDTIERSYVIPVAPDLPHPLGRAGVHHDTRNRAFRALVNPPTKTTTPGRPWPSTDVYDQGNASSCTAQAAIGVLRTFPNRLSFKPDWPSYDTYDERHALYLEAQRNDPWPGESYDGSSTDAPYRVLRDRGHISEWRWLFGEAELRDYVTWFGPVSVGTYWFRSMFDVDAAGYIHADEGSGVAGGHAWRIVQASSKRKAYRMCNSWGRGWGQAGRAWISFEDVALLLDRDGEAVTITPAAS